MLSIELMNLEEVKQGLEDELEEIKDRVRGIISRRAIDMRNAIVLKIRENRSIFTGALWNSVQLHTEEHGAVKTIMVEMYYGPYVEYGTRPHMPPIEALVDYAKYRGLPVWALAMAIKKHGTKPHPFFWPVVDEHIPALIAELREVLR